MMYFLVIFGLRAIMGVETHGQSGGKSESGGLVKGAMFLHNAILCVLSLAMFVGAAVEAFWRYFPPQDLNSRGLTLATRRRFEPRSAGHLTILLCASDHKRMG